MLPLDLIQVLEFFPVLFSQQFVIIMLNAQSDIILPKIRLASPSRGHDNVHDDMNMYVIMHDQCLFIAMINSFHTRSIAFHSMNSTFMHESV